MKNTYQVIGIMSGSSLDGVDLAMCSFEYVDEAWQFEIVVAKTYPFSEAWYARLVELPNQSMEILAKTHAFFGRYLGGLVNEFIKEFNLKPDFVSSHGHTIFHQPGEGYTTQIGDGAALSAICNLPVVCDFRSMDIALGGQGAPLVPIGDQLLFNAYDSCLNLGGISNLSFSDNGQMRAFDISPCNGVLNALAGSLDLEYDEDGKIAASGSLNEALVDALNDLSYYSKQGAKSLGREWMATHFFPVLQQFSEVCVPDMLHSVCAHIGFQIGSTLDKNKLKQVYVTGGGAFNQFLMHQIQQNTKAKLIIPKRELVQFKEALIFAFLGVLRIRNQVNVLASVTGAKRNQIGGALYGDFSKII